MRLIRHRRISGRIQLVTGLHIGAEAASIEIGGMDNPVIRDALTDHPYIPGSSFKGKIRSLLEWRDDRSREGKPCMCAKCMICRVFGVPGSEENQLGPTRVLFRDARLTADSLANLERMRREKGLLYVEEKYENSIDRLKGTAKHPRPIERVPAGTEFDFEIAMRVFDGDDEEAMLALLRDGLKLLESDALGGMGSRGYGKVRFVDCVDDTGAAFL